MTSVLSTLERSSSPLQATALLARKGFTCTLLTLEPGGETSSPVSRSPEDRVLFVVEGTLALCDAGITTVVNHGEASLLGSSQSPLLAARDQSPVRLLLVEIPPRQILQPPLSIA